MTIDQLHNKIEQLAADYRQLQQDNRTLRQQVTQMQAQFDDLSQRHQMAIKKLENTLNRIQQWQDTHDQ